MDHFVRRRAVKDKRCERHAGNCAYELCDAVEHGIPERHFS